MVSGIAATLLSLFPNLSPNEVRARLFSSTLPHTNHGNSLFGLVSLKNSLIEPSVPVWWPEFKHLNHLVANPTPLTISVTRIGGPTLPAKLSLRIDQKLHQTITVSETDSLGVFQFQPTLKAAAQDNRMDFEITIESKGQPTQTFKHQASLFQDTQLFKKTPHTFIVSDESKSNLRKINSYPPISSAQNYYSRKLTPEGVAIRIIRPFDRIVEKPILFRSLKTIKDVLSIDMNQDGILDQVIIGYGTQDQEDTLELHLLNQHGAPLFETGSRWWVALRSLPSHFREQDFSSLNSWSMVQNKRVPCSEGLSPLFPPELRPDIFTDERAIKLRRNCLVPVGSATTHSTPLTVITIDDEASATKTRHDFPDFSERKEDLNNESTWLLSRLSQWNGSLIQDHEANDRARHYEWLEAYNPIQQWLGSTQNSFFDFHFFASQFDLIAFRSNPGKMANKFSIPMDWEGVIQSLHLIPHTNQVAIFVDATKQGGSTAFQATFDLLNSEWKRPVSSAWAVPRGCVAQQPFPNTNSITFPFVCDSPSDFKSGVEFFWIEVPLEK
jgi:hypothetical protein